MYVRVKVFPGSKKEKITRKSEDSFEVFVREPAERNLANKRVTEIVAETFAVPPGKARLISGHTSRSKIFRVDA